MLLIVLFVGKSPPTGPGWNEVQNSDVDLWTWLLGFHPPGSVVTLLILGKEGFGVNADNFRVLCRQTQAASIQVRLVICHDQETQRHNRNVLTPNCIPSVNNLGKFYSEFWLDRLVANMEGAAKDLHYHQYVQELANKHAGRDAVGAVVSQNAHLSDRGRNKRPRP